ncbi:hypothetical protein CHUAL_012552 [Chamberlinius hualienensis]
MSLEHIDYDGILSWEILPAISKQQQSGIDQGHQMRHATPATFGLENGTNTIFHTIFLELNQDSSFS